MKLAEKIPVLFAVPNRQKAKSSLVLGLFLLLLGILFYSVTFVAPNFPYFEFMSGLLLFHGFLAIWSSALNLLFVFRYFLIWILIFGTSAVWALFNGEVKVAPFGFEFQDAEATKTLVFAGYLSVAGAFLGWHTAVSRVSDVSRSQFILSEGNRQKLRVIGGVVALSFGLFYVYKAGGFVSGGGVLW